MFTSPMPSKAHNLNHSFISHTPSQCFSCRKSLRANYETTRDHPYRLGSTYKMQTSQFQAVSPALPCRSYRNPNKVSGLHLLSFLLSNSWPNVLLPHVCWHDMALSAFSSWRMKIRKISSQKHDPLHVIIQSPL